MARQPPYRTCPQCEAHLDPGERCDCEREIQKEGTDASYQHTSAPPYVRFVKSRPHYGVNPSEGITPIIPQQQ